MKTHALTACAVMIAGVSYAYIEGSRAALVAGYAIAISAALIMAVRSRPQRPRPASRQDDPAGASSQRTP